MIKHKPDPTAVIRALRSAAPYIRLFKGKTFVVKAGGGVFGDPEATRALIEQVAILHSLGVKVVFVHGGGPQLTEVSEKLGVPTTWPPRVRSSWSSRDRARPKSAMRGWSSSSTMTLDGFRSRCRMPCSWACWVDRKSTRRTPVT